MRWTVLLYGFVMNKNNIRITKRMVVINLEPLDVKNNTRGCDNRYGAQSDSDTETILRIKTNIKKLELLRKLEDNRRGITEKLALIKTHDSTFGENSAAHNMSAGGLWKDFNTEIF